MFKNLFTFISARALHGFMWLTLFAFFVLVVVSEVTNGAL